jgi:hypothetical protein
VVTYEELVEEISALPYSLAMQEYTFDADHAEDDVAEAMAELSVAANLARAAQESLNTRVDLARRGGASWGLIGQAMGVSRWRAWRRA